jgi:hypothetical protein
VSPRLPYHRWTPDEDEVLERMLGDHKTADIARRLGLSEQQVNNHISRLGLSRKQVGVYSVNELMTLLATDHKLVGTWIAEGLLPGRHIAGRGRYGQFEVREQDLIAFLLANPHLVDQRAIDVAYRQYVSERWITLGEAFRRGGAHIISLQHGCSAGLVPEAILPRLVEGRRRWTSDELQRHQWHLYERWQRSKELHKRRGRSLWGTRAALAEAQAS